ncbi:MAG: hypothetical protein ACM3NR_03045 [Methanosarcina sp.]
MVKRLLPFLSLLIILLPATGQIPDSLVKDEASPKAGSFGLFENEDLLDVSLHFDLSTYFRKKPKDEYLKAVLTINPGQNDSMSRKVRLKTRGEFRNKHCLYAPIELNFKGVDFGYSDLDSIGKLKLVTQCSTGIINENYVLKEYLVYKLYQALTDTSFRVRLLRVTFYDTGKKRKPIVQYGIFLEPLGMLARRTNTEEVKNPGINQKHIIPFVMDRVAIFSYMIGNFDWSVPGQHNIKVLKLSDKPLGIAVPYDFDWSGVVNASYAIPAEVMGITNVRQRLFQGICRSKDVYDNDLDIFLAKKEAFLKIINDFDYLKPAERADVSSFLNEFYSQLKGNRDNILLNFISKCKHL